MTRRVTTQPTGDANLDYSKRETADAFAAQQKPGASPIADGRFLLEHTFTSGGSLTIAHGLKRKPKGWFVVRSYGAGEALLRETAADKSSLTLAHGSSSGVGCTVDIWVF